MARAVNSLPVPLSPVISTVASVGATLPTFSRTRVRAPDDPIIPSNLGDASAACVSIFGPYRTTSKRRGISQQAASVESGRGVFSIGTASFVLSLILPLLAFGIVPRSVAMIPLDGWGTLLLL